MEGTERRAVIPAALLMIACTAVTACTMIGSPELERPLPPAGGTSEAGAPEPRGMPEASGTGAGEPNPTPEPPRRGGNMAQYRQSGRTYRVLDSSAGYDERGVASWYGEQFHGRPTSSGEPFDMHQPSAAHRTLPLPTWVRVTNLGNGRSVLLRVNDRGPFANPERRIIDVSYAAAVQLGMVATGTASVRVQAVEPWQTRTR